MTVATFIGGPADMTRCTISTPPPYEFVVPFLDIQGTRFVALKDVPDDPKAYPFKRAIYQRLYVQVEGQSHVVYLHQGAR